jgi:hypothetical protein
MTFTELFSLSGHAALVTGGGAGIGKAISLKWTPKARPKKRKRELLAQGLVPLECRQSDLCLKRRRMHARTFLHRSPLGSCTFFDLVREFYPWYRFWGPL